MKPILLDTGVIVALLDRRERYHAGCVAFVDRLERPLLTCETVIAESCYLLRALPGAAETVVENVERGVFQIPFQLSQAAATVRLLLRKYRDLPASVADACLIYLAINLTPAIFSPLTGISIHIGGTEPGLSTYSSTLAIEPKCRLFAPERRSYSAQRRGGAADGADSRQHRRRERVSSRIGMDSAGESILRGTL